MKKRVQLLCAMLISFGASNSEAAEQELVNGALITEVVVRSFDGVPEVFTVRVAGGSGPCANGNIAFPLTGTPELDNRLLMVALAAYEQASRVRIYDYDYTTNVCTAADYLKLL